MKINYEKKFLEDAKEIYGDKYDYSKVVYTKSRDFVTVICPEHGEFKVTPERHIKNHQECPLCTRKNGTEEFIEKSRKVFGDKYDYSKVVYTGANDKVEIICKEHGSFWMRASAHYSGHQGCPKCAREQNILKITNTLEDFIERANRIHNNYYDYSETKYINLTSPVYIKCPIHGIFSQAPRDHLQGCGCTKCSKIKLGLVVDKESFLNKAKIIHGNKYDYSKVNYINNKVEVTIVCPEHGEFQQTPESHLKGSGCPKCSHLRNIRKRTVDLYTVLENCIDIHDGYYKYIYDPDNYQNERSKIGIICPKHGIFYQAANYHLLGNTCPECDKSDTSKGHRKVREFLQNNYPDLKFLEEHRAEFLGKLVYDFYIPDLKIAVEYNGIQHYKPVDYFGGEVTFLKQKERDYRKHRLSVENNITLVNIKYDQDDEDLNKLKEIINESIQKNKLKDITLEK